MKSLLVFIFSILIAECSFSQEEIHTEAYNFESWNFDWSVQLKEAYVFADACKLRSEPTAGSEMLAKLLIGDRVKVLGISSVDTTINGLQSKWIHVESGKKKGYVWGGLLTNEVLKMSDSTSAVWGISRIVAREEEQVDYYMSLRIFSKKQITKQIEFEVIHADDPANGELVMIKNPLLEGVEHIFIYNSLADACGVTWSEVYILETDDGLQFLEEGYGIGEGALFYSSTTLIFPTKEKEDDYNISYFRKPEKDQIFRVTSHDEYDESCIWTEQSKVETFEWKEGEMVPFCRQ